MLGRPYSLTGRVVVGQQLGRTLGFHTANLQVPPDKLLPQFGVYCGWVPLDGSRLPAVMNIGYRPTIEGKTISVEIHLLDWSGYVYDRILTMAHDRGKNYQCGNHLLDWSGYIYDRILTRI